MSALDVEKYECDVKIRINLMSAKCETESTKKNKSRNMTNRLSGSLEYFPLSRKQNRRLA